MLDRSPTSAPMFLWLSPSKLIWFTFDVVGLHNCGAWAASKVKVFAQCFKLKRSCFWEQLLTFEKCDLQWNFIGLPIGPAELYPLWMWRAERLPPPPRLLTREPRVTKWCEKVKRVVWSVEEMFCNLYRWKLEATWNRLNWLLSSTVNSLQSNQSRGTFCWAIEPKPFNYQNSSKHHRSLCLN